MTLPPKALNVLIDLKKELLDHEKEMVLPFGAKIAWDVMEGIRAEPERHTPERTMRHAAIRGGGYQRYRRAQLAGMG